MVSTRSSNSNSQPPSFAAVAASGAGLAPPVTPNQRATRSSTRSPSKSASPPPYEENDPRTTADVDLTTKKSSRRSKNSSKTSSSSPAGWAHTPSSLTLAWLAISLPLVAWDTGYVLLRPHSMPGGSLHRPLWVPYALYGTIDHMYGFKQWEFGNGFTGAQGMMNLIESLMYAVYVWIWYTRGQGRMVQGRGKVKSVGGRAGGVAAVVGFSAAVMTLSKTVLYWLNEYFSGFDNIGHNEFWQLIILWIIPNGAWLVGSTYMIYHIGSEIIDGLARASTVGGASARNVKFE